MKLIFIGSSLWIIYYMRVHRVIKQTYDASEDTFSSWWLPALCWRCSSTRSTTAQWRCAARIA
jgi:hypothetical protein